MIRLGISILFIWISIVSLSSQQLRVIDSLKIAFQNTNIDTQKVVLLNKISWEFHRTFPDSSRLFANEALNLAIKINYQKGKARALNLIAILEDMAGNSDSSRILNLQAHEIGKAIDDPWILSITSNDLANYFSNIGDNDKAISLYQESVKNMLKGNDTLGAVITYHNLGLFHSNLGNADDRNLYFTKAYELGKFASNKTAQAHAFEAAGFMEGLNSNLEEALSHYNRGLEIATNAKDKMMMIAFLQNIAFIHQDMGKQELAIMSLQKAEPLAMDLGPNSVLFLYTNLANIFLSQKKYRQAINYAEQGLELAEGQDHLGMMSSNLYILSDATYAIGDYKNAADYFKQNQIYQDSLYDEKQVTLANELEAKFQIDQKEKENQVLLLAQEKDQAIIKQKTTNNRAITLISILTGLLAFIVYWGYRSKNKLLKEMEVNVVERTKELKESNTRLTQSNQELEQFAYISSHDLKQPLRNILDFVGLLKKKKESSLDEEANSYLQVISDSSKRMDNLINDMLSYSVIGKSSTKIEVDCNEVFANVLEDLDTQIKEKGAGISCDYLPKIKGYKTEVHSLFLNLLSNSLKYSKANVKPIIKVSAKKEKGEFLFQVSDNGIGFDKVFADKIFSLFQRLENSSNYEGTGIGLAHCKKIIEIHQGKIWANSQTGEGTTIYFTIPI